MGANSWGIRDWSGLAVFFAEDWFERAWIIQEATCPTESLSFCGKAIIGWKGIAATVRSFTDAQELWANTPHRDNPASQTTLSPTRQIYDSDTSSLSHRQFPDPGPGDDRSITRFTGILGDESSRISVVFCRYLYSRLIIER